VKDAHELDDGISAFISQAWRSCFREIHERAREEEEDRGREIHFLLFAMHISD
jgi:hypothetical protein